MSTVHPPDGSVVSELASGLASPKRPQKDDDQFVHNRNPSVTVPSRISVNGQTVFDADTLAHGILELKWRFVDLVSVLRCRNHRETVLSRLKDIFIDDDRWPRIENMLHSSKHQHINSSNASPFLFMSASERMSILEACNRTGRLDHVYRMLKDRLSTDQLRHAPDILNALKESLRFANDPTFSTFDRYSWGMISSISDGVVKKMADIVSYIKLRRDEADLPDFSLGRPCICGDQLCVRVSVLRHERVRPVSINNSTTSSSEPELPSDSLRFFIGCSNWKKNESGNHIRAVGLHNLTIEQIVDDGLNWIHFIPRKSCQLLSNFLRDDQRYSTRSDYQHIQERIARTGGTRLDPRYWCNPGTGSASELSQATDTHRISAMHSTNEKDTAGCETLEFDELADPLNSVSRAERCHHSSIPVAGPGPDRSLGERDQVSASTQEATNSKTTAATNDAYQEGTGSSTSVPERQPQTGLVPNSVHRLYPTMHPVPCWPIDGSFQVPSQAETSHGDAAAPREPQCLNQTPVTDQLCETQLDKERQCQNGEMVEPDSSISRSAVAAADKTSNARIDFMSLDYASQTEQQGSEVQMDGTAQRRTRQLKRAREESCGLVMGNSTNTRMVTRSQGRAQIYQQPAV